MRTNHDLSDRRPPLRGGVGDRGHAEPSPTFGAYTGDEDLITPGVIGFVITFLVALATVFLLVDMNRRVRRTRYTQEIRQKLEAEAAAEDAASGGPRSDAPPTTPRDPE